LGGTQHGGVEQYFFYTIDIPLPAHRLLTRVGAGVGVDNFSLRVLTPILGAAKQKPAKSIASDGLSGTGQYYSVSDTSVSRVF
jgi:hypothetical protein